MQFTMYLTFKSCGDFVLDNKKKHPSDNNSSSTDIDNSDEGKYNNNIYWQISNNGEITTKRQ